MNPGLVIKLRPTGPWRIGPDSGARNRVDIVYHSDSLFGAVTWAMTRLGSLDEWLNATARSSAPGVSFSSCFPFLDEIGFVIPPRTIWPPTSPGLMSARVRWKSARFVPLGIVQAILGGQRLDPNHWSVDGPSECLLPVGRPGPFRTGVRWSAAVDRLTGAAERHSTACIEFRPGAGLWTIASFADDAARDRWQAPVMAAFRLLADSGFGGERSRGWGRSEAPEFVEGVLPDMIVGPAEAPAAGHSLGAEGEGPAAGGVDPGEPEFEGVPTEAPEIPAVTTPAPDEEVTTVAPELPSVHTPSPEMPSVTPQEGAPVAEVAAEAPAIAAMEGEGPVSAVVTETAAQVAAEISAAEASTAITEAPAITAMEVEGPVSAVVAEAPAAEVPATVAMEGEGPVSAVATEAASAEASTAVAEAAAEAPAIAAMEGEGPVSAVATEAVSAEPSTAVAEAAAEAPAIAAMEGEGPVSAVATEAVSAELSTAVAEAPVAEAPVAEAPVAEMPATVPMEGEGPMSAVVTEAPAAEIPAETPKTEKEAVTPEPEFDAPAPVPSGLHAHWLLSLFTPAADDTIDWQRGDYTVIDRGGRVDSPSGSGELKKQLPMVSEGSVLYAATEPRGSATDVAPDGFVHPVLRSGFAVSIPLPEVR